MQLSRMSPPLLQCSLLQIAMLMSQNRIDNELLRLQKLFLESSYTYDSSYSLITHISLKYRQQASFKETRLQEACLFLIGFFPIFKMFQALHGASKTNVF